MRRPQSFAIGGHPEASATVDPVGLEIVMVYREDGMNDGRAGSVPPNIMKKVTALDINAPA